MIGARVRLLVCGGYIVLYPVGVLTFFRSLFFRAVY